MYVGTPVEYAARSCRSFGHFASSRIRELILHTRQTSREAGKGEIKYERSIFDRLCMTLIPPFEFLQKSHYVMNGNQNF